MLVSPATARAISQSIFDRVTGLGEGDPHQVAAALPGPTAQGSHDAETEQVARAVVHCLGRKMSGLRPAALFFNEAGCGLDQGVEAAALSPGALVAIGAK